MDRIIRITPRTIKTCIGLRRELCGDSELIGHEDVSIIMRRCGLGALVCEQEPVDWGCGVTTTRKVYSRVPNRGIRYRAVEADARTGNVCFMWDDKLLKAEPGRWTGELFICNEFVGHLQFHLEDRLSIGGDDCVSQVQCPPPSCSADC
jgi:hypothetical protein